MTLMTSLSQQAVLDSTPRALHQALALRVLMRLKADGYQFVTPTPSTHHAIIGRDAALLATDARGALGWSLPFRRESLPRALFESLDAAGLLEPCAGVFRATVRISSLGDDLFLHSAFPTDAPDSVFFGPDTYRFASFLRHELVGCGPVGRLVDVGTGSGAGAVVAAKATGATRVVVTDINAAALRLAGINLAAAGVKAEFRLGSGLEAVPYRADLIIANPPFIAGGDGRVYRDGGDMHGARLSLDWTVEAAAKLVRKGRFLLYTGSAIVEGRDAFREALFSRLDPRQFSIAYRELDPDIFGDQLSLPAYQQVERIAAVGVVVSRRR